jgi:hypothetical protein
MVAFNVKHETIKLLGEKMSKNPHGPRIKQTVLQPGPTNTEHKKKPTDNSALWTPKGRGRKD